MDVGQRMTRNLLCAFPSDALAELHHMMTSRGVRHLPVVDRGRLVGMLSDRDLLLAATKSADGSLSFPPGRVARDLMSAATLSCKPDVSLGEVAAAMLTHKVDAVPITEGDGRLVGLVTTSDLLRHVVEQEGPVGPESRRALQTNQRWDLPESVI